jgi:hypothetical protein
VYLFGFPQSVYADIRTTREYSWWMIGLTFYTIPKYEYAKLVLFEAIRPIHGKRIFPETAGDVQK